MNTSYICENSKLQLTIRNNINGDFTIVKTLSDLKPGAFINIIWNREELMLPYSLRKDFLSFTDKKWDWRYLIQEDGEVNVKNPALYELTHSGEIKKHLCHLEENHANLNYNPYS